MPEIDDLAPDDVVLRAAADAAEMPAYADVVRRGERRRTRRRAAVLGSVLGAVVAAGVMGQFLGTHPAGAPQPAVPAPSEPRTEDPASGPGDPPTDPAAIVDHADARITAVEAQPDDPDARAVVWELGRRTVVAITDDGFSTRRLLRAPAGSSVTAAGAGRYIVAEGWNRRKLRIVDAGEEDRVVAIGGRPSGVAPGEEPVIVGSLPDDVGIVAVDVIAGTAHAIPLPDVGRTFDVQAFGGRLAMLSVTEVGSTYTSTYHWSDDGGATWTSEPLDDTGFSSIVPGPVGAPHFVIEGSDGATVFPFVAVHEMVSTGGGFSRWEYGGRRFASVDWSLTWGQEMRVHLSIGGQGQDAAFYRFSGGVLEEVASDGTAGRLSRRFGPTGIDLARNRSGDGSTEAWLAGVDGQVNRSDDGGVTWERAEAR